MTTQQENLMRVQQELWYLTNDENVKAILDTIVEKMNEIRDSSERLKQSYDEAQAFISSDNKYDEKYWVAAYILHPSTTSKETIQEFTNISQEILSLKDKIAKLEEKKIKETEYEIEELKSHLERKEYKLSRIYYKMYYGYEDSEEELEELEEDEASNSC